MRTKFAFVLSSSLLLIACGGGGSGGGDSDSRQDGDLPGGGAAAATFANSATHGLAFRTPAGNGLTNRQGRFSYDPGDRVTFLIGDIALGDVLPDGPALTPVDLVEGANAADACGSPDPVSNIAVLLQSIDDDADHSNGIQISAEARNAASGRTLDFDQTRAQFRNDPAFLDYLGAVHPGRDAVDASTACSRLQATQDHIAANGTANRLPDAVAGDDQSVLAGESVQLDGSGSSDSDGNLVGFEWTQTGGPAVNLSRPDAAQPSFTAPDVASTTALTFTLKVTDNDGATDNDEVRVLVAPTAGGNTAPVAEDLSFSTEEDTPLSGQLEASDADGDALTYQLEQQAENGTVAVDADGSFTYTPDENFNGSDSFSYRADDGRAESDPATARITVNGVNDAPVADAGPNQSVFEGEAVTLDGSGSSDPEGQSLQFAWQQTAGPSVTLDGADTASPSFSAPVVDSETVLRFRLSVDDGELSDTDSVTITVAPQPGNLAPEADAGDDQSVDEQTSVSLDGSASSDPDGEIAAFEWTQSGGEAVELRNADSANAGFTAPSATEVLTLSFTLTVTDNDGASNSDETTVTVRPVNEAPVAHAGDDQTVDEGDTVQLDGTASADSDGTVESFQWESLNDPPVSLDDPASPTPSFTAPEVGELERLSFRLSVTDNEGGTDTDTVDVFVKDVPVGLIRAGSAKQRITPTQAHIDGIEEARLAGAPHNQKFNLGGFGIDPTQNFPDPVGAFGDELTQPAEERVFSGSEGEEHTWLRAVVMERLNEDGSTTTIAFVVIDAVGAGNVIQEDLKATVAEATGIAPNNILFGQTHTHAGADLQGLWGGVPQDWIEKVLYPAAAQAVTRAQGALTPAELTVRQVEAANFNSFRRPQIEPDWDADTTMTLLQATERGPGAAPGNNDAAVIGSILQFNAHPTSINEDPRIPHADFILGAVDWLEGNVEESLGRQDGVPRGGVALYYNGPIADASSRGSRPGCEPAPDDGDYGRQRCKGEGMADAVISGDPQGRVLEPQLSVRHAEDVVLPVTNPAFITAAGLGSFNRYYDFLQPQNIVPFTEIPFVGPIAAAEQQNLPQVAPIARTPVSRITIGGAGGLEIVTIPGEATNTFGEYIQSLAAEANAGSQVMMLGLTHNSLGYIIPEEEFSYVDPGGDDGFTAPYTNYEEFVSLGPLTAPMLRLQAYNPLFDAPPERDVPPWLAACQDPSSDACVADFLGYRVDHFQREHARMCRDIGGPEEFCALLDPDTPLVQPCLDAGFPEGVCAVFGEADAGGDDPPGESEAELLLAAVETATRGCEILDPAHCMMPFPSDHFSEPAAPGSIQSVENEGTGRQIDIPITATPRNTAGKPVDPTEWNRNDGFSPGQMITTVVPGLAFDEETGAVPGAPPITNIQESRFNQDASVMVIDAETGERHLVWAEVDLNAGSLYPSEGIDDPTPEPPALMIRPAKNFEPGHRYIVVLRDMRDANGDPIPANAAFAACRDATGNPLPQVSERCAQLEANVFAPLAAISASNPLVDVERDESLFLAWDFTVASTQSLTGRLLAMRDDAFAALDGDAPSFTVDNVIDDPNGEIARRVEGRFTVPSYLVPADASPLGESQEYQQFLNTLESNYPELLGQLESQCDDLSPLGEVCDVFDPADAGRLAAEFNLPPNRLFYDPTDGSGNGPYGDGLPDRTGELTVRYTCNIPRSAISASGGQEALNEPARASLYGHGLLGGLGEVNNTSHVGSMGDAHNIMFCAADWYGFASGDLPNVLSTLLDLSLFPVVPDGSQQGMINFMYLARLLKHDQGFAAEPAFQVDGQPAFDRREVFYDGNSQGGILGGVVLATSPDVHRGVLGVPGMNYSTLLRRSVDFDIFSIPLYTAYTSTLDRTFLLSFLEMVWERSENNAYAQHLNRDPLPGLDGEPMPTKRALLHPAYADHQVTMWSADVMARTMDAAADGSRTDRHPDQVPFDFLEPVESQYEFDPVTQSRRFDGSALVIWDQPWTTNVSSRCANNETPVPPVGNVPPRVGDDPHECPRREVSAQCQKSHFMHSQGAVIDVSDVSTREACPQLPPAGTPPEPPDSEPPDAEDDPLAACQEDPSAEACPLSPLADALDPATVTEVIADLQACQDAEDPAQCAQEAVSLACQPKATADSCLIGLVLADTFDQLDQPVPPGSGPGAATAEADGESYPVYIASASGETIAFQVLEPEAGSPALDGSYPLVLHGHGYGGSRSTSGFGTLRDNGYGVISIDQRGFGESSGTVRTMDPDFEGQDLIAILDWAEANLDWLAYEPAEEGKPDTGGGQGNPLVGAIGGSYGGGFQLLLLNIDPKKRLDALVPDITWNDLRYSLNPGDVNKTGWILPLTAIGEQGSGGQQDPFIKESLIQGSATNIFPSDSLAWFNYHSPDYFCGALDRRASIYGPLEDFPGAQVARRTPPAADILFTQGMPDTLFNFNEAFYNYECYKALDPEADVRLYTHQSGHVLPFPSAGSSNLTASGGAQACGDVALNSAVELAWFDEHLKGQTGAADAALQSERDICLSLADGDAVRAKDVKVGGASFDVAGPLGGAVLARTGLAGASPEIVELATVGSGGDILAGIPRANLRVALPGGAVPDAPDPDPDTARDFDAILFLGLGVRPAEAEGDGVGDFRLIDDQIMPLRGLGDFEIDLVGVAERLDEGDTLALMVWGLHGQYPGSYSRDASVALVQLEGSVALPLQDDNAERAAGDPAELACNVESTGWQTHPRLKGSLHEHSGFSDGEIGTEPADYFAAGAAQGLDFMGSAEHSDNAMIPVTFDTDCLSDRIFECFQAPPEGVRKWNETQAQADAATTGDYTAFRGFEWTSDRFGHINVFFSQNDLNAKTSTGYALSMEDFWVWFGADPAIGGGRDGLASFNHPGREDAFHPVTTPDDPAYAFNRFEYRAEADPRVIGIEVYGKSNDVYDEDNNAPQGGWYAFALDKGWHLGPIGAEDEHGTAWAQSNRAKTIVLAEDRSRAAIKSAMRARRFFAVAHGYNDVRIDFDAGGEPMGSLVGVPGGGALAFTAAVYGVDSPRIEVVGPGGEVVASGDTGSLDFSVDVSDPAESWRYMRVIDTGNNDRIVAYSAPIWFRAGESYPDCGAEPFPPQ